MTRDDIIRMAREAGNDIERFATLVAAAEREACAKVCESLFDDDDNSCNKAEQCAQALRARGAA